MKIEVDTSDLLKTRDVLRAAVAFHLHRDHSNAALHLAKETRHSPLTSNLQAELDRLDNILGEA